MDACREDPSNDAIHLHRAPMAMEPVITPSSSSCGQVIAAVRLIPNYGPKHYQQSICLAGAAVRGACTVAATLMKSRWER